MLQKFVPYLSYGFRESGWSHTADPYITELGVSRANMVWSSLQRLRSNNLSLVSRHRGAEIHTPHYCNLSVAIPAHRHRHRHRRLSSPLFKTRRFG